MARMMDVYYIYTAQDGEKVRVFRNEDTRWSFPFYFKFDSADVQAKAKTLEFGGAAGAITSYGWRINMLSQFPNVTRIEVIDISDASTFTFFPLVLVSPLGRRLGLCGAVLEALLRQASPQ